MVSINEYHDYSQHCTHFVSSDGCQGKGTVELTGWGGISVIHRSCVYK